MVARSRLTRSLLHAGAAVLLWSAIETIAGRLGDRHEAVQIVWLRYSIHLALLAVIFLPVFGRRAFATQRPALQLLRGLLMFFMPMLYLLARGTAPAPWIWTVFWCAPLLVLGAAPLVGDRPPTARWLTAVLAWIGALAILHPDDVGSITGTVLALGMAAAFAGYLLLSRVLRDESILASLYFTGAGALLPTTLIVPWYWRPVVLADAVPAFGLGVASLLFLFAIDRALEDAPVGLIASLLFGVVALETARHAIPAGFLPAVPDAAGMLLIASGVLLLVRFSYRSAAALRRPGQDVA